MAKVLREAKRVVGRLRDLARILPERMAQTRRDRDFGRDLRVIEGALPAGSRLALFVLWQPSGVPPSAFLTCRHLVSCGYVPVIMSNGGLSDADRAALLSLSCRLIERPNLGHDFGAWRDAVLHLAKGGMLPAERLVLVNDSIWFPLAEGDDLLGTLDSAAAQYGFTGAAWVERAGKAHRAHFQSYLLMFGPKALSHPAFARFWQDYLASSRRDSVLLRGEKGLTQAMLRAGLCGPPTISAKRLLAHAEAADGPELIRILAYAALVDPDQRARRDALLERPTDPGFRPAALALIASTLANGYFIERHPYLVAGSVGMHFLKKRHEATSVEGRRQYLRAVAAGHIPAPHPAVLAEIRARDTQ